MEILRRFNQYVHQWFVRVISVGLVLGCWGGGGLWLEQTMVVPMPQAIAASPLKDVPTELTIHLGTEAGELKFVPNDVTVQAGKRYKFLLDNPSPQKHYFTAKDFADGIWTQKVDAGNVEVKGAIHELELRPGAVAQWVFVPLKPGQYELHCSIAGHADAGMVGQITITDS